MDNKITPTIGSHDIVDFMNGAGEMSTEGLRIDRSNSLPMNEEMVKKNCMTILMRESAPHFPVRLEKSHGDRENLIPIQSGMTGTIRRSCNWSVTGPLR